MLQPGHFPDTRPSLLSALRGDHPAESAWRTFFLQYAPAVFRVCRRRGLDMDDADEIAQQVMVGVSSHISDFDYDRDRGRFRHWVRTMTINKIRDLFRRRKATRVEGSIDECRDAPYTGPDVADLWEQEWQVQDLLWCVEQARADFAPRRFEAFRRYVLEGVSAAEAAWT